MAGSMSALTKKPAAAAAAAGVPRTAALGAGRRAPQPAARHAWAAARGRTQQHGIRAGIDSDQFDSGTKFADSMRPAHYDPDKAMWPNPPFVEATLAKFPEAGVANVEEGRTLYSDGGYTYLDVRSKSEWDDDGKIPDSVHVPLINVKRKWNLSVDPPVRESVQTANADFLKMILKKFPDKEAKLLVSCADGTDRTIQALMLLDAEGYTNIVGLKGGFNQWFLTFDTKNRRRGTNVKYSTVYGADGDAMGLHSTGAGFQSVDKVDPNLAMFDNTEWIKWADEVKEKA